MTSAVEARSLADLNLLASNPPQYPINPTESKREPLVLYISRVPGSRDVILSTFKPNLKNVTGDDIANSLYYVHLDLPSDQLLAPQPLRDPASGSPRSSGESSRSMNYIPRKPLPENSRVSALRSHVSDPAPVNVTPRSSGASILLDPSTVTPGLMASPSISSATPTQVPMTGPEAIPRRPLLGPRPLSMPRSMPPTERDLPLSPPRNSTTHVPGTPPRGQSYIGTSSAFTESTSLSDTRSPSPRKKNNIKEVPSLPPFSLSLIRRDPSSGRQWNVGRVYTQPTSPVDALRPALPGRTSPDDEFMKVDQQHQSINVMLETSGYAKFRGFSSLQVAADAGSGSYHHHHHGATSSTSLPGLLAQASSMEGFVRQVVMTYRKSWRSGLRKQFGGRRKAKTAASEVAKSEHYHQQEQPHQPQQQQQQNAANQPYRQDTINSVDSTSSSNTTSTSSGGSTDAVTTQPGPGLKPRGYAFTSPWLGRCEFHTGNAGRSLLCRHVLDRYGGGNSNPLASTLPGSGGGQIAAQLHGLMGHSADARVTPLSELRFNLPGRDIFKSSALGTATSPSKESHAFGGFAVGQEQQGQVPLSSPSTGRNKLRKLLKRRDEAHNDSSSSDCNGEGASGRGGGGDERHHHSGLGAWAAAATTEGGERLTRALDTALGLGREKAGGGTRGTRAKMGKLIIYDEGLKMLDLSVAANVGVWWAAWEKTF